MELPDRRDIFPLKNWNLFLEEGKLEFEQRFSLTNPAALFRRFDFEFIRTVGKGTFGRVYLTRIKSRDQYVVLKIMDKMQLYKKEQVKHTVYEKKVLQSLNCPFCVYLLMAYKDNSYLYLSLPFVQGGEMFTFLRTQKRFDEALAKFYGAQVLLALEYLHYCDLIYRDLKPENILIDINGYLKLTDFGFCKVVKSRTYTLCGTPEYLAPETLMHKGYGRSVDWWAFGVLLYEMSAGWGPFECKDAVTMYGNVLLGKYYMPKFFSKGLANLIENLLQVDVTRRFGNMKDGINDIKKHRWFKKVNWDDVINGNKVPPYVPTVSHPGDSSNFDRFPEIRMEVAEKDYFTNDFEDF